MRDHASVENRLIDIAGSSDELVGAENADHEPRWKYKMNSSIARFRYLLVYLLPANLSTMTQGTKTDLALLQIANWAKRRALKGTTDCILFVLPNVEDVSVAGEGLDRYGFPSYQTVAGEVGAAGKRHQVDDEEMSSWIGDQTERWVTNEHPGAIAMLNPEPFTGELLWWAGIEGTDTVGDWQFEIDRFAGLLPNCHRPRAKTWLAILEQIHAVDPSVYASVDYQYAACHIATLANWLQGFEGASGNGYNHFDAAEAIEALRISSFFLGYNFADMTACAADWERYLTDADEDIDALPTLALKQMVAAYQAEVHQGLVSFFGGKPSLFWALYSTIWPTWDRSAAEACNSLLSPVDTDDLARLDAPWRFVDDGWVDEADE